MATATKSYITAETPLAHKSLSGGLNSAAGPLGLDDSESSDLQNIDFDKFGSILKRNGCTALNTTQLDSDSYTNYGLHWFEYVTAGSNVQKAMTVLNGKLWKMDDLDGTWDDITGTLAGSITNAQCCFVNFLNEVHITQPGELPHKWDGTTVSEMTVPTGLTSAKYCEEFNNYFFLANCTVSGAVHGSRVCWYNIKSNTTVDAADFIDVAKNDGQEITRIKVLGDRLVIYKTRTIYNLYFTGDSDIPFTLPGGGKSNSEVGCIAPYSVQEVQNGHVFLATDGLYYYDGMNASKISDKVGDLIAGYNGLVFGNAVSMVQKEKNRYFIALTPSGGTENSKILVWDYSNNAFTLYTGWKASSMATFYMSGIQERIYFFDYNSFCYRGDVGADDYLENVQTAINTYYYTNWKNYDDLVDKKGIPNIVIYHRADDTALTFAYSYDFEEADQYSQSFSLAGGGDVYDTGVFGTAKFGGSGGSAKRRDLTGRGRVVRFKFANNILGDQFRIDGLGVMGQLETKA